MMAKATGILSTGPQRLIRYEAWRRGGGDPDPKPTIPGDETLADDNAAAEQRAEWADYGEMEIWEEEPGFGDGWYAPDMRLADESDWRWCGHQERTERTIYGITEYIEKYRVAVWFRCPLLSADYV